MAKLNVAPSADTIIRVMMVWEPLDASRDVTEQQLPDTPVRNGFTVVEWGGSKIE